MTENKINPLYTPDSLGSFEYDKEIGYPGEYPFTRGIYPTMYRGRLWTMRQYAGFGSAQETNKRFRFLLSKGQTGLSIAFDLPTQMGYDSNHPKAEGEVGRVGVAIDSLEDMRELFKEIPLDKVSTSMTINATASILLAMYLCLAEEQNVSWKKLSGTVQNDILKEYIARGTYIYPPEPSLRVATDVIKFCAENRLNWNPISISGYHIREAGATAVQELAFTFADAIAYTKSVINAGLNIDEFASRLSFFFGAHNDFFEEIAKFRAARRIWAKIVKGKFNAASDKSCRLRFHTQTDGSTLTAQQPKNNIVRVALQALSAVLGGTQSLHTNSYDEALGLPSEDAAQIALRTQQIIAHESSVANTVDPMAGSYFVEALTNQIEKKVWEYLDKIEKLGGAEKAIDRGYFQNEIHESAYDYQKAIEKDEEIMVGVNKFVEEGESKDLISEGLQKRAIELERITRQRQIDKLKTLKEKRDNTRVKDCLVQLKNDVGNGTNLMPSIIQAVGNLATLGEISDTLREVFGEYREKVEV